MPIQEYENVKGFTFVQSTEPAESKSKEHDTWYNTSNNKVYMFQNYRWKMYVNAIYFPGADYGYVCGGSDGSNHLTSVIRFFFPFDSGTATHVGNLNNSMYTSSACNSSNYGYVCGDRYDVAAFSTIERFSFPFNSGTASHVGNLTGSNSAPSACNSSDYGYICGGWNSSTYISTIDRIKFPFDSGTATHVGNLSETRRYSTFSVNNSLYGYTCGGHPGGSIDISNIDRFSFPFDSGTATHVGNLSYSRQNSSSNNSSNYGYVCGGAEWYGSGDPNNQRISTIDRFSFPFDSGTATHVGNLSGTRDIICSNNSSNYGYVCGGWIGSIFSTIDRFSFPFDSGTATHVGNLAVDEHASTAADGTDFITLFDNLSSRVYV